MRFIVLPFTALFLLSCEKQASLPGFSVSESGLEYKLIRLGDEDIKPGKADFLEVNFSVNKLKDGELLRSGTEADTPFVIGQGAPLLQEAFSKLVQGDSAAFILRAKQIRPHINLNVHDTEKVVLHVGLNRCLPEAIFTLNRNYPGLFEAFPDEASDMAEFLADIEPQSVLAIGDMYFISTQEGEGSRPMANDIVNLDFEGFFTSGKKFDSTIERKEPFEYTIGESGQVLLGFNIGVRQLKKGGEALFVLPAHMAFDKRGSTDGTVPPNTTVIYRVKLNEIIRNES
jgi:FKBP-type peptidyl-prolyl cis-trans isomerase